VAHTAEENVELNVTRERLAPLECERPERRSLVEGGEGFGLN